MKGNHSKSGVDMVLCVIASIVIAFVAYPLLQYLTLSSEEKEFYQYWYLENIGNQLTIQDKSVENNKFVRPKSDIDIDAFKMWEIYQAADNTQEVVVALLDTAVDEDHELLKNKLWSNPVAGSGINTSHGADFVAAGSNISDEDRAHGTMCAGVLAKVVNTDQIKIMCLRVLQSVDGENVGSVQNIKEAILFAEGNGAKICNLSLDGFADESEIVEVIKNSNMLFVISAGNGPGRGVVIENNEESIYSLSNVISVANLNYNGKLYKESNYGPDTIDIAAPGTSMLTAFPGNKYEYATGTAMAVPVVSGIAALVMSVNGNYSAEEVKAILQETATELPELQGKVCSGAVVNGGNALAETVEGDES